MLPRRLPQQHTTVTWKHRPTRAGSIFIWKKEKGFMRWIDELSWERSSSSTSRGFRKYYEADEHGRKREGGLCKKRPSADSQLKQATSTEMESPSRIGVQSNDVDGEDDDTWDDNMIDAESSAISPDLEGFRQHILRLNPNLKHTNKFLVDRFSNALLDRYNELLTAKMEHSRLNETCFNGSLCLSRRSQEDLGSCSGLVLPPDIPLPPTHTLSAEFECPICFTLQKPNTRSEWIEHVLEDMQLFRCTWETCNVSQGFKSQKDWERHEMEKHRHPNKSADNHFDKRDRHQWVPARKRTDYFFAPRRPFTRPSRNVHLDQQASHAAT
ncbi:hypothetical protein LY76DRAFT_673429 [Colletotrichum caudatum]|nr:hypothetical protein LY76DRAFT_673429 [Colletotrichum caudatum]